jgi:DNA replication protein DnaC
MSSSPHPAPATCPRCNGFGWVTPADSFRSEPCECQGDLRRRQRITAANIPRRYLMCRIANFHSRDNASVINAKRQVQEFVDMWPLRRDGRGLLLAGGCGVGKTHLAVATLLEIINAGKDGKLLFSNFQELIQEIQASFDPESAVDKSEILRPLIQADLLVLDELGSQKPSNFVQDILYFIINSRYNDMRTTIFTTNTIRDLNDRIGDRLRSRLYEMTSTVEMSATDYRPTKF